MACFTKVFFLFFLIFSNAYLFSKAPETIPPELYKRYTLSGQIPVLNWYRDDSYEEKNPKIYSSQEIELNIEKIKKKEVSYYGKTDSWLYEALEKFPILKKEVAIIGSTIPWYESIIIAYGGTPTTIEYNKIISTDPRLKVMTVKEYEQNPIKFDIILSISSIEHDGLGRYGDPLNPEGDFIFMKKAKSMLKKNGLLLLAMPVGQDALVWNVHRIYGPLRLALLLKDWEVRETFGFSQNTFKNPLGDMGTQPVYVLSPRNL